MISALRPIMDLAEPILKAKPEVCEERRYRYTELTDAAVHYYSAGYFDYYAVCFLVYGYSVRLTG